MGLFFQYHDTFAMHHPVPLGWLQYHSGTRLVQLLCEHMGPLIIHVAIIDQNIVMWPLLCVIQGTSPWKDLVWQSFPPQNFWPRG